MVFLLLLGFFLLFVACFGVIISMVRGDQEILQAATLTAILATLILSF